MLWKKQLLSLRSCSFLYTPLCSLALFIFSRAHTLPGEKAFCYFLAFLNDDRLDNTMRISTAPNISVVNAFITVRVTCSWSLIPKNRIFSPSSAFREICTGFRFRSTEHPKAATLLRLAGRLLMSSSSIENICDPLK